MGSMGEFSGQALTGYFSHKIVNSKEIEDLSEESSSFDS